MNKLMKMQKILLKQTKAIGKDRGKVASMVITIGKLEKESEILRGELATSNAVNYDLNERVSELTTVINALNGQVPPAKKAAPAQVMPEPIAVATKPREEKTTSCVIS